MLIKIYILKYRNKIFLISKDSESIEGGPIITLIGFYYIPTQIIRFYQQTLRIKCNDLLMILNVLLNEC